MKVHKQHFLFRLCCVCFVAAMLLSVSGTVFAAEDEDSLPTIIGWENGMAVSSSGTYLRDTWAIDETGISEKEYVLLGQDCKEVMRIASYPDGITGGDTAPLEQPKVKMSLSVPEGVTGDITVYFESEYAEYSVLMDNKADYQATVAMYPGIYEITYVEVSSDINGKYQISNLKELDPSAHVSVSLVLTNAADDTEPSESTAGDEAGNDPGNADKPSSNQKKKDNELLEDTIKLFVVVMGLLITYGIIKYRRGKSEEMNR